MTSQPRPVPYTPPPASTGAAAPAIAPVISTADGMEWRPMDHNRPTIQRMVASFTGHPKTGKTHVSLATTPAPVFYANIDMGTEGVSHKMAHREGEIMEVIVRYKKGWPQAEYKKLWAKLEALYDEALSGNKGTLVIDSETENFELQMLAEFGKTTEILPRTRGHLNTEKRAFINACLESEMNVLFMSRAREVWLNDTPTGGYVRKGYNALDYDLQVVGWTRKQYNPALHGYDAQNRPLGGTEYGVQIVDSRLKSEMEGQTYWGASARFDMLLAMSWA